MNPLTQLLTQHSTALDQDNAPLEGRYAVLGREGGRLYAHERLKFSWPVETNAQDAAVARALEQRGTYRGFALSYQPELEVLARVYTSKTRRLPVLRLEYYDSQQAAVIYSYNVVTTVMNLDQCLKNEQGTPLVPYKRVLWLEAAVVGLDLELTALARLSEKSAGLSILPPDIYGPAKPPGGVRRVLYYDRVDRAVYPDPL